MKLRQGRHRDRMVYLQVGDEPQDSDPFVAFCETWVVAEMFCRTVNSDDEAEDILDTIFETAPRQPRGDLFASAKALVESPYGQKLAKDLFGKAESPEVGKGKPHEPAIVDAYGNNSGFIARLVCTCGAIFFGAVQATGAQAKYNVRLQYKKATCPPKAVEESG